MTPPVPGTHAPRSAKWCFILSLPRSGSTLLTVLLDRTGQCLVLPETHFFVFHKDQVRADFGRDRERIIEAWTAFYRTKRWIGDLTGLRAYLMEHARDLQGVLTGS